MSLRSNKEICSQNCSEKNVGKKAQKKHNIQTARVEYDAEV